MGLGRKEGRKEHVLMFIKERREEKVWIMEGRMRGSKERRREGRK